MVLGGTGEGEVVRGFVADVGGGEGGGTVEALHLFAEQPLCDFFVCLRPVLIN